jgi:hypothetical protein
MSVRSARYGPSFYFRGEQIMTPADLEWLHKYMVESEGVLPITRAICAPLTGAQLSTHAASIGGDQRCFFCTTLDDK